MKIPTNIWFDQYDCDDEIDYMSDNEIEQDFSEYMWMENEEEFDKNELQRLRDEELMNECYEAMCDDELEARLSEDLQLMQEFGILLPFDESTDPEYLVTYLMAGLNEITRMEDMCQLLSEIDVNNEVDITSSTLNPFAEEFVPRELVEIEINI